MEHQAVKTKSSKRRPDLFKLVLIGGLSLQAWGVVVGAALIMANFMH